MGAGSAPGDFDRCVKDYLEAFHTHRPFVLEYRLRRHDGEYRWICDYGTPIEGPDGCFTGYIGACYDISEHKRAEKTQATKLAITRILSSADSLSECLPGILQTFGEGMGWQLGEFWRIDDSSGKLIVMAPGIRAL